MTFLITYRDPKGYTRDTETLKNVENEEMAKKLAEENCNGWLIERITKC